MPPEYSPGGDVFESTLEKKETTSHSALENMIKYSVNRTIVLRATRRKKGLGHLSRLKQGIFLVSFTAVPGCAPVVGNTWNSKVFYRVIFLSNVLDICTASILEFSWWNFLDDRCCMEGGLGRGRGGGNPGGLMRCGAGASAAGVHPPNLYTFCTARGWRLCPLCQRL